MHSPKDVTGLYTQPTESIVREVYTQLRTDEEMLSYNQNSDIQTMKQQIAEILALLKEK